MQNTLSELTQLARPSAPSSSPPSVMRKVVQSVATKKFLTHAGGWTRDIHNAADFFDPFQVRAAMEAFKLRRVQLYYVFLDNSECDYNFVVPL